MPLLANLFAGPCPSYCSAVAIAGSGFLFCPEEQLKKKIPRSRVVGGGVGTGKGFGFVEAVGGGAMAEASLALPSSALALPAIWGFGECFFARLFSPPLALCPSTVFPRPLPSAPLPVFSF